MTNHDYKAIADRLVERGIGDERNGGYTIDESYILVSGEITGVDSAHDFCHDWRVAGACMERYARRFEGELKKHYPEEQLCTVFSLSGKYTCSFSGSKFSAKSDSFPRAIILAYLEAADGA